MGGGYKGAGRVRFKGNMVLLSMEITSGNLDLSFPEECLHTKVAI